MSKEICKHKNPRDECVDCRMNEMSCSLWEAEESIKDLRAKLEQKTEKVMRPREAV